MILWIYLKHLLTRVKTVNTGSGTQCYTMMVTASFEIKYFKINYNSQTRATFSHCCVPILIFKDTILPNFSNTAFEVCSRPSFQNKHLFNFYLFVTTASVALCGRTPTISGGIRLRQTFSKTTQLLRWRSALKMAQNDIVCVYTLHQCWIVNYIS